MYITDIILFCIIYNQHTHTYVYTNSSKYDLMILYLSIHPSIQII